MQSSSFCNKDNVVNETLQQHIALQMMKKEISKYTHNKENTHTHKSKTNRKK